MGLQFAILSVLNYRHLSSFAPEIARLLDYVVKLRERGLGRWLALLPVKIKYILIEKVCCSSWNAPAKCGDIGKCGRTKLD